MSEQHRTRLYAWLCEQTDEPLAEYVMACLAPAPLSDLVTKDYMAAEFALLRKEIAEQREADRADAAALREADRTAVAEKLDAVRAEHAVQREADRTELRQEIRHRHYWLVGIVATVGVPIWLNFFGIAG